MKSLISTLLSSKAFGLVALLSFLAGGSARAASFDFVIEAEDFNRGSGQHQSQASTMPYVGGAYNGLSATADVDYFQPFDDPSSDLYRVGESPNVPMVDNPDMSRGTWTMTTNFRIGWTDVGDWYNYTRNFPSGNYRVYAALSHQGTNPGELRGSLQEVTSGATTPAQTTVDLGVFDAPGSGGWGSNNLVPLRDAPGGTDVLVNLQGIRTVRYTAESGDIDFFVFERVGPPLITQQPTNLTVLEGGTAVFTVQLASTSGATYQWLRNNVNIPGATSASYILSPVAITDNGAQFRCFITNPQGSTNSNTAILTVQADSVSPTVVSVANLGDPQAVIVLFSEPVEAATATLPSNYSINNGVTVNSTSFAGDTRTILLRTSLLSPGVTYTLTVGNVRDQATPPNVIAPNPTQRTFSLDYVPLDVTVIKPGPETRGPSSRKTPLVVSEIMYNPAPRTDGRNLEFVEIYNSDIIAENISGYRLSGDIDYIFPTNTTIPAGGYAVVAPSPADVQAIYGITGVLGGFTNNLPNDSGTVRLRNKADFVMLEVNYSDEHPWPVAADNAGHSMVLARPSYGEDNPKAWDASDVIGGTPKLAETPAANPHRTILINEFLSHTDDPEQDYIELFNYGTQAVSVAGCIITDDPTTNKFVIPSGSIPARGYLSFNQTTLGFALSAEGETIYLKNPANTRVIDVVRFKGQENGVSSGRSPDGGPGFYRLATKTPGTANGAIRQSPVVINEIMFNPISGDTADEYVELYNRSGSPVNLSGWRLSDGISHTFPVNAVIPANGYVVVANNLARMLTNYAGLTTNNSFGNFGGNLASSGERIALTMPDQVVATNNGVVVTNTIHIVVNEVTYGEGGRWGKWSDGGGSSLELIDPNADGRLPANWTDSNETAKAPWTVVQFSGVLDNGTGAADELQLFQQGAGECLVDDVELLNNSGINVIANTSFEGGLTGWVPQGNHDTSSLENTGYLSSRSLHVRALGRGDTGANRIRTTLNSALATGTTATFRAKVRWLRGHPELLMRTHGNWIEAIAGMNLPSNLGTPGARNSQTSPTPNTGPSIHNVAHSPVLPAAGQAVTVRAQVHDPHGLASLLLKYRVDPSTNFTTVSMAYNGAGLYSATIPGQVSGATVAFHIQAADGFTTAAVSLFPNDAPTRECLVRFGEGSPGGGIGVYRMWITQSTLNRWNTRLKLDNGALDATFVYGNQRVVYNIGTLYSGSPWISPGYSGPLGGLCGYVMQFPPDDVFLGAKDFVLDWPIRDGSAQYEQIAYWMARELGIPYNHRRFVHVYVNGNRRGTIYEDTQQPNSDVIEQVFPDDTDGDLHKIEDWFEFGDIPANHEGNVDATLENFTTTGGAKKLARYRWTWRKRATDTPNDYSALFSLVDAVNANQPEPFESLVESQVDVDEWMRIFAIEHIAGNWDSYGYNRGKNMYAYKPVNGKWTLMMWDIDFVFSAGGDGPTTDMFNSIGGDTGLQSLYSQPAFRRAYYRAWHDAAYGPMEAAIVNPLMDAKYNALIANGVSVSDPTPGKDYIAQRRSFLIGELAGVATTFTITSNGGNNFSTNRNYITLTGTAPVEVKTIKINGVAYQPTWNTVTGWSINVALAGGNNVLTPQGFDSYGRPIAGYSDTITVNYTGTVELPQDFLVINEIMYNPVAPDASFVEIHNRSALTAFDLSNWRLEGADFAFPEGTIVQPGGFLVVANDPASFAATYGGSVPIAGVLEGTLDNGGETLKLVKPGLTPPQDVIIDEVSYDDDPPWPVAADGFGPSLQLIDPNQDNNRVMNWAAVTTNGPAPGPQWQFVTVTGTASSSRLYVYLNAAGEVYIDDLKLVAGSVPDVGLNYIQNGNFDSTLTPWNVTANVSGSSVSTAIKRSGAGSLRLVCSGPGSTQGDSLWLDTTPLTPSAQYTLSFWYLQNPSGGTLTIRLSGNGIRSDQNIAPAAGGSSTQYTPGAPNSVRTNLALFPLVWLNEVQPNNVTGLQDNAGDRDPWVELHNSSGSAVDLTGYYLSDNYTNLVKWPVPAATTLTAGQFRLVWLDNEPGETSGVNLHANFRASSTNGSVVLTRVSGATTSIVDYLNYSPINNDRSYGAFPNGTPAKRQNFYFATPGAANNNAYPPNPIYVNEWMADNTGAAVDPADGGFEDWFELFNAGPTPVDLSGYTLTDETNQVDKFTIPAGTVIPANGFLLVWADDEVNQNGQTGDLHVPFRLGAGGDFIGLYAPNGTNVNLVAFGQQTNNISQGRWPDGNSGQFYFMATPTPRLPNVIGSTNNSPPVLAFIGNRSGPELSAITFTGSATDPNAGQALSYSLDPGAPAGATINSGSGVFSWTPTESQGPGNYPVTVRVTDNGSPALSDSETLTLSVTEANLAPGLAFISDQTVNEGNTINFTALGSDSDLPAQTLTYSLDAGAPAGASINPSTGLFTWTPTEAQGPATNTITVRVTDNGSPNLSGAETFVITVTEGNAAPVLATVGNKTVTEGSGLLFTLSATDSDVPAQTLTYSMDAGAPAGANFNPATRTFTWTPTEAQGPGNYNVTFRVTDNGSPALNDLETISILVNEGNTAPGLAAIADQIVTAGSLLSVTNSATDTDIPANTLTFSLDPGAPSGASIHPTTGVFTWTPSTNQAPSTNVVTVRVIDSGSPALSDVRSFTIVVTTSAVPRITTVSKLGNVLTITWSSQSGKQYRLESSDTLSTINWNTVGDYNATGASTSGTDNSATGSQRYYRIQQLN
ncbi:MAG TPA: lamin tail domain-containing protein [Verrucomicrobiae bacterium]|nr:lamin tail domain-containing protein [Verrucomicrobiae bacterium]